MQAGSQGSQARLFPLLLKGGREQVSNNNGTSQSLIDVKGLFAYSPIGLFASKRAAFTLAEVLVTLAVIGIVAAMTIPNIVQSYNEKVTVTKVKKMYSTLSNAYELVKIEYGDISQWSTKGGNNSVEDSIAMREKFKKYFIFSKLCDNPEDLKECGVADVVYMNDNKEVDVISPSVKNKAKQGCGMVLSDGSSLYFHSDTPDWKLFYYDVNGLKEPNTFGRDIFPFEIRLVGKTHSPICTDSEDENTILSLCDLKNNSSGFCCTAWVVRKGNMDYLK